MQFFGCQKRKPFGKVKAQLPPENATASDTGAVLFVIAVLDNIGEQ